MDQITNFNHKNNNKNKNNIIIFLNNFLRISKILLSK